MNHRFWHNYLGYVKREQLKCEDSRGDGREEFCKKCRRKHK